MTISIITINLNNASGLIKTIESVLNQKFKKIEYIIIDGGSTDNSVKIIKKYEKYIAYWESSEDKGIYDAQNKGAKIAKGEYCLFLNSGDFLFDNDVLNKVFNTTKRSADILYGNIVNDYHTYRVQASNPREQYITFKHLMKSTFPHPSTFIKKSLLEKCGYFDENLKIAADWKLFMLSIFKYNASIDKIDLTISIFNMDGISNDDKHSALKRKEREDVLRKEFNRFLPDYDELEKLQNLILIKFWYWLKKLKVRYLSNSI